MRLSDSVDPKALCEGVCLLFLSPLIYKQPNPPIITRGKKTHQLSFQGNQINTAVINLFVINSYHIQNVIFNKFY